MPTLAQSLPANDLEFLRIIAALWGIELTAADPAQGAVELAETLCDAQLLEEVVSSLPDEGQNALGALVDAGGRLPWVVFTRRFGDVREMGAAKRDREQPYARPNSAAEMLWYRALLARAFFETEQGPQEFAYLPDDLRAALEFIGLMQSPADETPPEPEPVPAKGEILGRPASPGEKSSLPEACSRLIDDAATLLAALRLEIDPPETPTPAPVVRAFLEAAEILKDGIPQPAAVKSFLELPRRDALTLLENAWRASRSFNELRQLPGLLCEGGWDNDPLAARQFLLKKIEALPAGQWWSLAAFIRDLKIHAADYQRPTPGDYDTWFIKRANGGGYLRGFEAWDEVDGALGRYLISGPLFWLGQVELAGGQAFRVTAANPQAEDPAAKISLTSEGRIHIPRLASRAARYQIARFCEWEAEKNETYRYRISAEALKRAAGQGLKAGQLLGLLAKLSAGQVPPALAKTLQRWERNGSEAHIETLTILKVNKPAVLEELRQSRAGRFVGEILGPTTVRIPAEAVPQVLAALAELGLLAEVGQG